MGVVFLLHIRLVVLAVGTRAGLVDTVLFEPMAKVEVEELAAIVAVNPEQVEGLAFPVGFQCLEAGLLTTVPYGPQLRPAA